MRSFEKKLAVLSSALTLALGASACGEGPATNPADTKSRSGQTVDSGNNVTYKYYKHGIRKIVFQGDPAVYSTIIEFCDGPDLVEETSNSASSNNAGNAVSRSVDHVACNDRTLTPEDFK